MANPPQEVDKALQQAKSTLEEIKERRMTLKEVVGRTLLSGAVAAAEIRSALGLSRLCQACHQPIRIQIFRGDTWCSDDCRKKILKET